LISAFSRDEEELGLTNESLKAASLEDLVVVVVVLVVMVEEEEEESNDFPIPHPFFPSEVNDVNATSLILVGNK
jgi:hypothetical protein